MNEPIRAMGVKMSPNERIAQALKVMLDLEAYDIAIQFLQFIKEKREREEGGGK